jgi:hypothetical protein
MHLTAVLYVAVYDAQGLVACSNTCVRLSVQGREPAVRRHRRHRRAACGRGDPAAGGAGVAQGLCPRAQLRLRRARCCLRLRLLLMAVDCLALVHPAPKTWRHCIQTGSATSENVANMKYEWPADCCCLVVLKPYCGTGLLVVQQG